MTSMRHRAGRGRLPSRRGRWPSRPGLAINTLIFFSGITRAFSVRLDNQGALRVQRITGPYFSANSAAAQRLCVIFS